MKIKKSTLKNIGVVFLVFFVALVYLVINKPASNSSNSNIAGTEISADGSQVINMNVRGGYFPNQINAKANTPIKLNMITKNTFDCSIAVSIPQLQFRKNLPTTGTTEILIPAQASGTTIKGTCTMGMYSFKINFK